ncbi:MAG TPA: bifunctional tetrahydrofolate synthase/dihydrofolate synthase [Steroidobacteraceae bacterium]|jgi:dihydrofolate synthase/folylpolyglutamate synthase|nr:bifunctional tetrahydrofolate synthase/dihydrofolate synthase [Steroidobacteraceae bacterium]
MRSLEEWLEYQTRLHPQAIDLGLDRLREVLKRLEWRGPAVPVITVAGTNGKGSVCAYCASILTAAGHRVGTFTSPHLRDYRERIRIHDRLVRAEELVAAFERIERARAEIGLTFFEFNALAAFLIFEAARLDAWVLEIGMGGRLDAVNVLDPDAAVVVSVGLDHQEYLGTTLAAIAREKAGIFRPGRPAILGSRDMPAAVADTARAVGAPLKRLGQEFAGRRDGGRWSYRGPRRELDDLPPPALLGDTQLDNAATAIAALEEIERLPVPREAVARGLEQARLVARFQVIRDAAGPAWILDVAHNPAAARVLASNLSSLPRTGRTLAVCGILADKDAAGVAAELERSFDEWWCVATDSERGRSGEDLARTVAAVVAAPVRAAPGIESGCMAALAAAARDDRIVVFGSFHTVGPAMTWLESRGLLPPDAVPEYTATPRPLT